MKQEIIRNLENKLERLLTRHPNLPEGDVKKENEENIKLLAQQYYNISGKHYIRRHINNSNANYRREGLK